MNLTVNNVMMISNLIKLPLSIIELVLSRRVAIRINIFIIINVDNALMGVKIVILLIMNLNVCLAKLD